MTGQLKVSSPIAQARVIAGEMAAADETSLTLAEAPPDSFMVHRPNRLAESYQHGQNVAQILAGWKAGPPLQAAGLLHSFVCKGVLTPAEIAARCGDRTAFLVQTHRAILLQTPPGQVRGKPQLIRRVRLYMGAYHDPDLAFLEVASLWDHFIVARQSKPGLQRAFAREAQAVLIPLLTMLGMWELKEEVEEWVMQHGHTRQDYEYLLNRLTQTHEPRRLASEHVQNKLQPVLPHAHIARKIRTPVHIYNPQLPEKTHPEWLQKVTIDILVDTVEECYAALRWVHHFWRPLENSLIDYLGGSKLNGYRCLQTAVIVPLESSHMRVHFHIRTREMDEINRWGLAALHLMDRHQVELPHTWWSRREEGREKIFATPMGSLPETLYVFSPQGEIFRFHRGCTVVDYAYQVHSEVAHQCKRFRVNGDVVGPTTTLRHLDLVELEQDPQFTGPTRVWLNAAHTTQARSHIKRFLKRRSQGSQYGQRVFERKLQALKDYYRIDIPDHRIKQALGQATRHFNLERREDLLAEIAAGRISSDPLLHPLFSEEITQQVQLPSDLRLFPHQLNLAQCCKPRPGDDIVGRPRSLKEEITGLKIHRADCQHIRDNKNTLPLTWRLRPRLKIVVRLEVTALYEVHLLDEALQAIYQSLPHVVLHKLDYVTRNGVARMGFTIEAKDQELIDQIAERLAAMSGHTINEVRQMQLLFAEREELVQPMTPVAFNPYRRLPVRDREMFFGRSEKLAQIYEFLRSGIGAVFVRGQKRVGKTSLLLYLKEHYLDRYALAPIFIDCQILGQLTGPTFFYSIAQAVYNELQADDRISDVGPPLEELFEVAPATELAGYLQQVQSHFGVTKLVLLIDEFSRTMDAYDQHKLGHDFFQQWRGLLQTTMPQVSYIMVIQQQTYDTLLEQVHLRMLDPIWHLLEIGETLLLEPLNEKDARQLIERPTYNYLDYSSEAIRYVWRLTGGSPFLIQVFCFNLVRTMARDGRRQVEWTDVERVQEEFMHPNESIFAHLLDIIRGIALPICQQMAKSLDQADEPVSLAQLTSALPQLSSEKITRTVQELASRHILLEPEPGTYQFASLLFGRWLARNMALEQLWNAKQH